MALINKVCRFEMGHACACIVIGRTWAEEFCHGLYHEASSRFTALRLFVICLQSRGSGERSPAVPIDIHSSFG